MKPTDPSHRQAILDANIRGSRSFTDGRLLEAAMTYEEAVHLLQPSDDDIARSIYGNLGLAYYNLGRYPEAMRAFLRALDGQLGSNEQWLRFLVDSAIRLGRIADALRFLAIYQPHLGAHPGGWTLSALERMALANRIEMSRILAC